jgi:threonine/homoserine/homoserine lactone efflux protein
MDLDIISKIVIFWVIFFITPGPVWISVMETTRKLSNASVWDFFVKTFLPVNLLVQATQATICVIFVDLVSRVFSEIGLWLYISGASYILYLSYKVISSKQSNVTLHLSFSNLAMVMLLSPKIWILFPSGAITATLLEKGIIINSLIFSASMVLISSAAFVLYAAIGKIGTKLLNDNFSYLSFLLLILFSGFLFTEAISLT